MDLRSEQNLLHVEPDLAKIVREAAARVSFIVIAGIRTTQTEAKNVADGASETMHSRHLPNKNGLAAAVDVMATPGGHASWTPADYEPIAAAMKACGESLNIPVEWGGDWTTLKDWGHFQLPWSSYP